MLVISLEPKTLRRYSKTVLDKELLEQFCTFLDKRIGLYYPKERWSSLEKKLVHIRSSLGFDNTAVCLEWLMKHPIDKEKLDVLTSHLTIGETYFFRDKQLFEILKQQVLPDIVNRHLEDRSIRIWSAGCCTGEEPYSIAILLHRLIPDIKEWKVSILGSDINPEFLLKAEKGRYNKWSFRTTPPEILERYFKKNKDGSFNLNPEIHQMVNFGHLNLVDDAYPDIAKGIYEMDLIFCHNVLIYFSESQIKNTIQKLSESLCPNGWLSVSSIEVPYIAEPSLNAHRYLGAVFFKKEPSQKKDIKDCNPTKAAATASRWKKKSVAQVLPLQPKPAYPIAKTVPPVKIKSREDIFEESLHLYRQKAYKEVIALLGPSLFPFQNDAKAIKDHFKEIFLLIRTYANQGDLPQALEWSERALEADDLNARLHYLHAALLQDQGKVLEAIKSVKRALFIDSNFMMAYLMLGILEKHQGNNKAAKRSFNTALDLIGTPLSEDFFQIDEEYTAEYLKDLISNNLKNL